VGLFCTHSRWHRYTYIYTCARWGIGGCKDQPNLIPKQAHSVSQVLSAKGGQQRSRLYCANTTRTKVAGTSSAIRAAPRPATSAANCDQSGHNAAIEPTAQSNAAATETQTAATATANEEEQAASDEMGANKAALLQLRRVYRIRRR